METVQAIFLRQEATVRSDYYLLPTSSIFVNYECLGGGETGVKEADR